VNSKIYGASHTEVRINKTILQGSFEIYHECIYYLQILIETILTILDCKHYTIRCYLQYGQDSWLNYSIHHIGNAVKH